MISFKRQIAPYPHRVFFLLLWFMSLCCFAAAGLAFAGILPLYCIFVAIPAPIPHVMMWLIRQNFTEDERGNLFWNAHKYDK